MVDGHGFRPYFRLADLCRFTLGMTVGRFTGGWFIDAAALPWFGLVREINGALGIGLIIFVDSA